VVSVCIFCMSNEKTSNHLFLTCHFVVEIWMLLGVKLNYVLDLTSVSGLFSCIPLHCSSHICDIYVTNILYNKHTICLVRNIVRFISYKI